MKKILIIASALLVNAFSFAEIVMPKIFSDNMVLQRGEPVKIWGKATPNASVEVKFGKLSQKAKASEEGKWSLFLPSMKANKENQTLQVFENSQLGKEIQNVLVGEVWIAGGQSNMQWTLNNSDDGEKAKERANYPMMRFFLQRVDAIAAEPQEDSPAGASWVVVSPESAFRLSAIGFYFIEKLMQDLDVPVAIVETPLGGSAMVVWLTREDMEGIPSYQERIKLFDEKNANYNYEEAVENQKIAFEKWKKERDEAVAKGESFKKGPPREPRPEAAGEPQVMPAYLYNAKIAPIQGFTSRGFIWYQGESDATNKENEFLDKFERLIDSWRKYWDKKDMPFYFVQLASFGPADWAETRWQQYLTTKKMKNVELVTAIDLGTEDDIHPRQKTEVGVRLANIALKNVYDKKDVYPFGPEMKSVSYKADTATVSIDSLKRKLVEKGEPRGFEVLIGGKWIDAIETTFDAKKNTISIKAPDSKEIEGIRYLGKHWSQPDVYIYSEDELPLLPFIDKKSK